MKTAEIGFRKEGSLEVYRQGTDSLLAAFDIEIADNEYETQTGLMYRSAMEDGHAMWFIFPDEALHSFYMKNTEFSLDLLFVRADQRIATIMENAEPLNERGLSSRVPVRYVLEINAGLVAKLGLREGDSVAWSRIGAQQ